MTTTLEFLAQKQQELFPERTFPKAFLQHQDETLTSNTISPKNSFAHYGVMGMRWGYRKRRDGKGKFRTGPKAGEVGNARDRNVNRKTKPSSNRAISNLSDIQLTQINSRLRLEQEYARLTKTEKTQARKFVEDVVVSSANKAAKNVLTGVLTQAGNAATRRLIARLAMNAAK